MESGRRKLILGMGTPFGPARINSREAGSVPLCDPLRRLETRRTLRLGHVASAGLDPRDPANPRAGLAPVRALSRVAAAWHRHPIPDPSVSRLKIARSACIHTWSNSTGTSFYHGAAHFAQAGGRACARGRALACDS